MVESPWPTARKVSVIVSEVRASAAPAPAKTSSAAHGASAARYERRAIKSTPAYQSAQASNPGAASRTVANGSAAKPCAAERVAPESRSASHQSGNTSTTTSAVAIGIAARPGRRPSAFAATETSETRWNEAARSGAVQSAAAAVEQASINRCSPKRRFNEAPAAGK